MRKFPFILLLAVASAFISGTNAWAAEHTLYISQVQSGVYEVYDPATNTSVFVKDVQAYVKRKYGTQKVEGFGGNISEKDFAKGATPVEDAVETVAKPVNYAAGTAYNAANLVPSWRKYTIPLRAVFGSNTKNKNTRTSF